MQPYQTVLVRIYNSCIINCIVFIQFEAGDLKNRNCWGWRRPVIAIALTVIVFIIDACAKVYSTTYLVNEVIGKNII